MTIVQMYRHLPIAEKHLTVLEPGSSKQFDLHIQIFHPQLDYTLSRIWECKVRLSGRGRKQQICSLEGLGMCSLQAIAAGLRLVAGAINLLYEKGYRFLEADGSLADETLVRHLFLSDFSIEAVDSRVFGRRLANGTVLGQNVFSKESLKTTFSFFSPIESADSWSASFKIYTEKTSSIKRFSTIGSDSFGALVASVQLAYAEFKQRFEQFSVFQCSEKDEERSTFKEMREILFSCCGVDSTELNIVLGERFLQL